MKSPDVATPGSPSEAFLAAPPRKGHPSAAPGLTAATAGTISSNVTEQAHAGAAGVDVVVAPGRLVRPKTAAALLDVAPGTFRLIYPALVAHCGLKLYDLCGPRFDVSNLLQVAKAVGARGLHLDRAAGVVRVGDSHYPISSSPEGRRRSGLARGRSA